MEAHEAQRGRRETNLELSCNTALQLAATFGGQLSGAHLPLSNFLEKLELLSHQEQPVPETDTGR